MNGWMDGWQTIITILEQGLQPNHHHPLGLGHVIDERSPPIEVIQKGVCGI